MLLRLPLACWLAAFVAATLACRPAAAQEAAVATPVAGRAMSPEDEKKAREAAKAAAAAAEQAKKPDGDKKSDDAAKKTEADADKEKDSALPIITRPDKPEGPSNADRLHEQIGADGRVQFNVQEVPWDALLKWLADVSQLSLDWQELPGDFLNLRTQHSYTLEEARDVINLHLLARGFTMLKHGELLRVVDIKKINQGLVPRVTPEQLDECMPHEFVKVSFPLDWMLAADAVEELKPMLSPNGTLTALTSTNRLEAMDAVVNLREIRTLLSEEQTGSGEESLVRVFRLTHVRAGDILPLLMEMVGLENHANVTGNISDNSARQIMQQMQQLQQIVQQNANKPNAGKAGGKAGDDSKPKLIVNERDNSILVHATPDKMEIIRQAIAALDTPSSRKEHLLTSGLNFQVHRLSTLDPTTLVGILNELGDLSPMTKMEVDATGKSLIVYGSLADQFTVKTLVDRLDGSTRSFYVIPLRRLRAEEVAGTITYMLGEEEEDNNRNSSSYYYSYYEYRYGRGSQQQEERRPFRVDADIENNRLMLWANEVEREEVWDLLVKLGEVPSDQRNNETMRVLDLSTDENAQQMLERIRSLWPSIAPNELEILPHSSPQPQTHTPDKSSSPAKEPAAALPPAAGHSADPAFDLRTASTDEAGTGNRATLANEAVVSPTDFRSDWQEFVAQVESSASADRPDGVAAETTARDVDTSRGGDSSQTDAPTSPTTAAPANTPPPVIIQRGPNGRLILGSPDTEALNRIEDLITDLTPKRRDYVIFKLKHPNTWAYDVEWNLNAFFEQEGEGEKFLDWYGYVRDTTDKSPNRLSKRKPLKIIGDDVSRTILVQGATEDQLRTIAELIEIYDQPEVENPLLVRETRLFTVQYSDAEVVAEAIKDAYRDLLSPNDPAFEKKNGQNENDRGSSTTITYDYGSRYGNDDDEKAPDRPARIGFKGALSMGVDEISNTIVVSATRGLLIDIERQIKELDELAKANNNIRVMPVSSAINLAALRERMSTVLTVTRPRQNGPNGQQPEGQFPNGADPRGNFNNGFNNWNGSR